MPSKDSPKIPTYWVGIHFVLCCGPVDKVNKIFVSDTQVYPYSANGPPVGQGDIHDGDKIFINAPKIFGGTSREGGIYGLVDFLFGKSTQQLNNYLLAQYGAPITTYRGVVSAILNDVYVGTNYYFKPWGFEVTRIHTRCDGLTQWEDAYAEVPEDSGLINAVHIIRECLTDPVWGLGHDESLIDDESFLLAAQTCYAEGLGFSFFWNSPGEIIDFISTVRQHINANLYIDRKDGKFHLTLLRPIEDLNTLVHLTPANTRSVEDFAKKTLGDLVSAVTVKYTDMATNKPATIEIGDSSLAIRQGKVITKSITYEGVATADVAQKLAIRDLLQLGAPVFTCTIHCNREAEDLNPGDAFQLFWPDYLEDELTFRVISIDLGTAVKGEITINAIEDFFEANDHSYFTPIISSWVDPINTPQPVLFKVVEEMPYYIASIVLGDANAKAIPDTKSYAFLGGKAPTSDSFSAAIASSLDPAFPHDSNTNLQGTLYFCYSPLLLDAISEISTSIRVSYPSGTEKLTVGNFIQIDNEFLGITSIAGAVIGVIRGVLDTVPAKHSVGAEVYAIQDANGIDMIEWLYGETVYYRLLTCTPRGYLEDTAAPNVTLEINGRLHMPYPPANVKINDFYWPESLPSGTLSLTWATRNRLTETAGLVDWYSGNITSEAGVTYSGELRQTDNNTLLSNFSGVTGTSANFTTSYVGEVKAEIWSVRSTFTSFQRFECFLELT